jgi:sortase A
MATTTGGFTESDNVVLPSDRALLPPASRRHARGGGRGRFGGGRRGGGRGGRGRGGRQAPAHAAWRPPLGRVRRTIREVGFNLITGGIVVLLFVAYQLWGTGFAEAKSQNKLKHQFSAPATAQAPAPAGGGGGGDNPALGATGNQVAVAGPPLGSAIAHLVIPKIGIDKYVVEGVTEAALKEGPGHYPGTPMPGEPGNASIAGHRTTYGAPFYDLEKLASGDDIFVTTKAGEFHYSVTQTTIVKPTDVGVIAPTSDNRLTLTTCNPKFSATSRLILVAMLTDLPKAPPKTLPPIAAITSISLGTGDHSAWPPTLLYGLAAVAVWIAVRLYAARRRDWRWLPFAVGIPICFVPLWFLFENAIRLLPNNI